MGKKGIYVNKNRILNNFWDILNLAEDYISTGSINKHPTLNFSSDSLKNISDEISVCKQCRLYKTRIKTVSGDGNINPLLMIIGEGPGAEEDKTGKPFVGKAGQYLDKWMEAIGLNRQDYLYLSNIVKCRPPKNRDPLDDEISLCLPYLERQVALLKPKLILTLGRISTQVLTNSNLGIGRLRGKIYEYHGIKLIPTYHPSAVLRNPDEYRKLVWEDLKKVKDYLEEKSF